MRVMISAPYMMPRIHEFRGILERHGLSVVVPPVTERLEEEQLLEIMPGVHGVICGDDRFTSAVFEAAEDLRVISKWGTGIDSIDVAAAAAHGVVICRTPNAFSEPVADSVFAYLLAFARRLPETVAHMRNGGWEKLPGYTLAEQTLGIIGVGDIGKAVARRAMAFGMPTLLCDRKGVEPDLLSVPGIREATADEVFASADVVTLHPDLNPSSHHLVDARSLSLMKSSALLINTSRGPVVDEAELVKALAEGRLRGAGLDVFEDEPLPQDSPLRNMPNVLLAPHNANSSPKAWENVHIRSIENLLRGLDVRDGDRR